jgi:sulfite exporter TauE/SafE
MVSKGLLYTGIGIAVVGGILLGVGLILKTSLKTILIIAGVVLLLLGLGIAIFGFVRKPKVVAKITTVAEKTTATTTATTTTSVPVATMPATLIAPVPSTVYSTGVQPVMVSTEPVIVT